MDDDQSQGWAGVFDSFLTQYVFRDLVGKCVPGLVLMWFLAASAWGSAKVLPEIGRILTSEHFHGGWVLLLILPISWVAGLLVQGAATLAMWHALYCPPRDYTGRKWPGVRRVVGWMRHLHHDEYFEVYEAFTNAPATRSQRRTRERHVAAKEASAHIFFAIVMGCCLMRYVAPWEVREKRVVVAIALGLAALISHAFHLRLEWRFMKRVALHPRPTGAVGVAGSRRDAANAVADAAEAAAEVHSVASSQITEQAIANKAAATRAALAARASADAEPEQ